MLNYSAVCFSFFLGARLAVDNEKKLAVEIRRILSDCDGNTTMGKVIDKREREDFLF